VINLSIVSFPADYADKNAYFADINL